MENFDIFLPTGFSLVNIIKKRIFFPLSSDLHWTSRLAYADTFYISVQRPGGEPRSLYNSIKVGPKYTF